MFKRFIKKWVVSILIYLLITCAMLMTSGCMRDSGVEVRPGDSIQVPEGYVHESTFWSEGMIEALIADIKALGFVFNDRSDIPVTDMRPDLIGRGSHNTGWVFNEVTNDHDEIVPRVELLYNDGENDYRYVFFFNVGCNAISLENGVLISVRRLDRSEILVSVAGFPTHDRILSFLASDHR